jgi:hypothetical protein
MSKTMTTPETQTQTQTKPSWNNCAGCELMCEDYKVDWSRTKYRNKHPNSPEDHKVSIFSENFIYDPEKITTIPGIVANALMELSYDSQEKKYHFIPDEEYDYDQIYDMCGGVLWGVSERTDDTIEVTFMSYDHHNEPIETQKLALVKSSESESSESAAIN